MNSFTYKRAIESLVVCTIIIIVLLFPMLLNEFPLSWQDFTLFNVGSAFSGVEAFDSSSAYSNLIYYFSSFFSLWSIPLFQAGLLLVGITLLVRQLFPDKTLNRVLFCFVFLVCTALPWLVSMLVAHVFFIICFINIAILLTSSKYDIPFVFASINLLLFTCMDASIAWILGLSLLIYLLVGGSKKLKSEWKNPVIALSFLLISAIIVRPVSNKLLYNKMGNATQSPCYYTLVSNLNDKDYFQAYMSEECVSEDYFICSKKDKQGKFKLKILPGLNEDFETMNKESGEVFWGLVFQPAYLIDVCKNTFSNLFSTKIEYSRLRKKNNDKFIRKAKLSNYATASFTKSQNKGAIIVSKLASKMSNLCFVFTLLFMVLIGVFRTKNSNSKAIILFQIGLITYIIHACYTSIFYQSNILHSMRFTPLIILIGTTLYFDFFDKIAQKFNKRQPTVDDEINL